MERKGEYIHDVYNLMDNGAGAAAEVNRNWVRSLKVVMFYRNKILVAMELSKMLALHVM